MIPILFEKNATTFTSNGLGRLAGCTRCIVTEERNGIYECEFDVPVADPMYSQVTEGRIIACTHDEQGDIQPFDIYSRSEPINGIVTFYAHHVSYRLSEMVVEPFTASNLVLAMQGIGTHIINLNTVFSFVSAKTSSTAFALTVPKSAKSVLMGEEGSILDVYGGDLKFDKFEARIVSNRGTDTNVSIRYGKNLIDYRNENDTSGSYNSVVPYWYGSVQQGDESVEQLVMTTGRIINSGQTLPSGRSIAIPMDLSDAWDSPPTSAQLGNLARSKMTAAKGWLPTQTVKVDFVQLWQTEEYKDYAPLQRLKLCDTCGIFVPMYGTSLRAKVIRVEYNVLLDRYDSMELGDKPVTYSAVLEKQIDSKVAGVEAGFQAIAVDIATVEANAAADATNKANAAQAAAEATASADATSKANAAQSAAEATASADATSKANAAEANAKSYADSGISALRTDLEGQIDAKIETWAQSTNPATSWTTAEIRAEHNGDLWLYTGTTRTTVGAVVIKPQGVYQYRGSTGLWAEYSSVSNNLFDLVDGKTTIFYGSPSGTYSNKQTGDYLVDSSTGITYRWSGSAWVKQTDYKAYTDSAISTATQTIEAEYEQAIEDATELIRGGTGGYVVTTVNANGQPIELLITDNINLNQAVQVWRWNQGGLAHSSNGYNGPFSDVAITQDGKINASMILAGQMTANLIKAGVLSDAANKNSWDLDSGALTMSKGSISLGGKFSATDAGHVEAMDANIGPLTVEQYYMRHMRGTPAYPDFILGQYGPAMQTKNGSACVNLLKFEATGLGIYEKQNSSDATDTGATTGFTTYLTISPAANELRTVIYAFNGNVLTFFPYTDTYPFYVHRAAYFASSLTVNGTKSRVVDTDHFSDRLLYAYETPTPYFGDIGEAEIDSEGSCFVSLDDIFSETIAKKVEYQVFLQKEGPGDCWVAGKARTWFEIQGTPGLKVAWEIKAKQRDYELTRLEQDNNVLEEYAAVGDDDLTIDDYINEQEALLYG